MTNPDDIVRVRARNGGRASVYEANGWAQFFKTGLLEGNGVVQNTVPDMNVLVGGSTAKPDVLIATNPSGYKVALDVVGQQAVAITAPGSDSRISSIVAYTDDLSLASTETNITGSPSTCGLIVVNGATSATPSAPDDTDIRTAITADGATGSQAAYCVIAEIEVESTTTTITDSIIDLKKADKEIIAADNIDFTTLLPTTTDTEIDTGLKYDGKTLYVQRFTGTITLQANKRVTKDLAVALSDDPYIITHIGWTRPGASSVANTNSIGVYGADGPTFNGAVDIVGIPGSNTIQLRWTYNGAGTGHYDITVYYIKVS